MAGEIFRPPAVAGMFYHGNPETLSDDISRFLEKAPIHEISGRIIGVVAPHAGYVYSGYTASVAFKQIIGKKYNTVIIISPSHREYFPGISVFNGKGYETPLGVLEVDDVLRKDLLEMDNYVFESVQGHRTEHALEVQLPFLQKVLKNFKILPLVIGDQKQNICESLGESLGKLLSDRDDILIVASSDLSHFYSSKEAQKLDKVIVEDVESLNCEKIFSDLSAKKTEACGGGPICSMIIAAKKLGANKSKVLHYCDSGDTTGDKSEVVGYLSAIIWKAD